MHFSRLPYRAEDVDASCKWRFRAMEVHATGENQGDHHGPKHTGSNPGERMKYLSHADTRNERGRKLAIELGEARTGLRATMHLQFYDGVSVVRSWTELRNESDAPIPLEYVTSFALTGLGKEGLAPWERKLRLSIPHSTWCGEAQWRTHTLPELGFQNVNDYMMKRISLTSTGTWSTAEHLPMGYLHNDESGIGLLWQIEHHGSWHWEIGNINDQLYLHLSGPTWTESHWLKQLRPGETFVSVKAAIGSAPGFDAAVGEMTNYRRAIRRPNEDNRRLPVIYNNYMNGISGDPREDTLLPCIDAAAAVGCEYYVVDCGWYSDGNWWFEVGDWQPSAKRFPNGIGAVMDYIHAKGMVPGLWLELEVMGIDSETAKRVPDDWFFCRNGKRIIAHSRYQLDYRNPEVIAYVTEVVDRLVLQYRVGYIKMDYNINAGVGTDIGADSPGDGLLEHNRAYLGWLDGIFAKYPSLVIENCSSGGMRCDYSLLERHSIYSASDQAEYRKNAVIAAASASAVTPEQLAVWSYPNRKSDEEAVIMNMASALLLRVHQSGELEALAPEMTALVREGIAYYKSIRDRIPVSLPIWPTGMPSLDSRWTSFGLVDPAGDRIFLVAWRFESPDETLEIPLPAWRGRQAAATMSYPRERAGDCRWNAEAGTLSVRLPAMNAARAFEVKLNEESR
nr:glycoside hydrolase family 36 protein [Paenibacillus sacheonensis]